MPPPSGQSDRGALRAPNKQDKHGQEILQARQEILRPERWQNPADAEG